MIVKIHILLYTWHNENEALKKNILMELRADENKEIIEGISLYIYY